MEINYRLLKFIVEVQNIETNIVRLLSLLYTKKYPYSLVGCKIITV